MEARRIVMSVHDILNHLQAPPQAALPQAALPQATVPQAAPPQTLEFRLDNSEWCPAEGNEPIVKEQPRGGVAVYINHSQHRRYRLHPLEESRKDFPFWQEDVFFLGNGKAYNICRDDKGYFVLFDRQNVGGYTAERRDGDDSYPLEMIWYTSDGQRIPISKIASTPHCKCSKKRKRTPVC
jgi:hypothetical protein